MTATSTATPIPTPTPVLPLSVWNLNRSGYETDYLQVGKKLYTDRTYVFVTPVPDSFWGRKFIRTKQADKDTTAPASFLSFDVNQSVIVYVGIDQRITTLPGWLKSWTKLTQSSQRLNVNDPGSATRILYSKRFAKGKVVLGSNRDASMPKGRSMYTVVIVPEITGVQEWEIYAGPSEKETDRQVSLLRE